MRSSVRKRVNAVLDYLGNKPSGYISDICEVLEDIYGPREMLENGDLTFGFEVISHIDMIEIALEAELAAPKRGLILDYSKWHSRAVGEPHNLSFVLGRARAKKRAKKKLNI